MTHQSAKIDAQLTRHPVMGMRSVGAPYVFGRFHPESLSLRGYRRQLRTLGRTLRDGSRPTQKFLIFGRARSGTTLFGRILNAVDDITCDGEMLHFHVFGPKRYLDMRANSSGSKVYGSKLLSFQMLEVQGIKHPHRFMAGLVDDGYTLIHLRRGTYRQSFSLSVAQKAERFHLKTDEDPDRRALEFELDPNLFLDMIRYNVAALDFEDELMSHLPHLRYDYETALSNAQQHQATVDDVCSHLGVPTQSVVADTEKVGASGLNKVTNVDQLKERMVKEGFGHLI